MIFKFTYGSWVYLVIKVDSLMEAMIKFNERYPLSPQEMQRVRVEECQPADVLEISKARRTVTQWCRVFPEAEVIKYAEAS